MIALTEFADPTMTVRVKGVACVLALTESCSPGGDEAKVRTTVRGSSLSVVVEARPPPSVAVSLRSR